MPPGDPLEIARHVLDMAAHIDRTRRRHLVHRDGVIIRDLPGGWFSHDPAAKPAQFPSASNDRVYWLTPESPITPGQLEAARDQVRQAGRPIFVWLAPWAWTPAVEEMLAAAGATLWPHVEYIALSRSAGDCPPARPSTLRAARVEPADAPAVLETIRPWYGAVAGIEAAKGMLADAGIELFAAFDGGKPVAFAKLTLDGDFAYLGAAGTDPAHRGRGGQTALIRARVERAAERAVRWCVSETNTVVATSLSNLQRCGFRDAIRWRVYEWRA